MNTVKPALLFLMSTGIALASGWDDYDEAFQSSRVPTDGPPVMWMARRSAGVGERLEGNPMPADMRFSLGRSPFGLESTPGLRVHRRSGRPQGQGDDTVADVDEAALAEGRFHPGHPCG